MLSVHGYFDAVPVLGRTDTGGQVVYVIELAKHLAKRNIEVDIYTRWFEDRAKIENIVENVRIIRIPCGSPHFIEKERLFEHLPEFIDNMERYIGKENLQYDLYHSHYWDAGFVGMELARRMGQHFIHTSHSLGILKKRQMPESPENEKKFRFTLRIEKEKMIFDAARSIIATTPIEKENYIEDYRIHESKVKVIPPGVDTERFYGGVKEKAKNEIDMSNKHVVFSLSRIDSRKGLDLLIRGVGEAMKTQENIVLIIGGGSKAMGSDEKDELDKLTDLVDELNMQKNVIFTGYLPDDSVPVYYCAADVFVIPSRYEPFGLTILEAMSVGTPVIATRFGGPVHIITHGTDGFLVDPENTEELGRIITRILADRELHEYISRNGLTTIHKRYSWDSVVDTYLEHVDGLGGKNA